ncbi:PAS domain-containing methyl-accepting chemotaxis protein [Phenylobacterium sp.]|jgi:methyl-accepting chemotaxis protein|uniref:methyl-accepting chemotaxis protein n=1 Tax=Phenylobacterium sp. TaxID=1871053 RepID=UPI002E3356C6|nr:PAS domain-containing methyl-accepting chemotaxis protein [Phenylobacterium sp.]HEX2558999.1 PAS domain-containing methyl-accepting chemotaxis protein [Phenylobacterium sp.]
MTGLFRRSKGDAADARLRHLETMFKALGGRQGHLELELDGTIRSANEMFLQMMGYELSEIVGRHHDILVYPEQRGDGSDAFWSALRSGQPVSERFKRLTKDGRELIFFGTYYALCGPDGRPYQYMLWGADVSDQVRAQRAADEALARRREEQQRAFGSLHGVLTALAKGDLTARMQENLPEEYLPLKRDLEVALAELASALGKITETTDGMNAGASEIVRAADELARRTEQQATTLEQTAAALEEITSTVKRTAEGAIQANTAVGGAKQEAERSGEVVREAVAAMDQIAGSARQISQIIGVIDEIAFQTNLLALNAGVEAARAGEAGRGFAVVASEVRALAQRSAEAAKEIKALISASTQQVGQGVELVGQTGQALESIVARVAEISGLVSEIAASAQEQATGLAQVNAAVSQMDHATQQNAAMVEESTAASHALQNEVGELVRLVSRFRTGLDRPTSDRGSISGGAHRSYAAPALKTVRQLAEEPAEWEEF